MFIERSQKWPFRERKNAWFSIFLGRCPRPRWGITALPDPQRVLRTAVLLRETFHIRVFHLAPPPHWSPGSASGSDRLGFRSNCARMADTSVWLRAWRAALAGKERYSTSRQKKKKRKKNIYMNISMDPYWSLWQFLQCSKRLYRKVVYKCRSLCAIFNFLVRLLFKCGFYLRVAYMQCSESAKPVKAAWHM